LNSALHRTFAAKETALGARLADLSRPHARANAFIPHNAACAYAAVGRYDDALAMCRIAVDIGYAHLDRLAKDKDLGALLRRREFKALFA
jgi:predicted hotdog family 3-hydroxylacyl-ACP dehydratase